MKPTLKTIILCSVAILDCILGILVIGASIDVRSNSSIKIESEVPLKNSSNYMIINDLSKVSTKISFVEKEKKEEKKTTKVVTYKGQTIDQIANQLNKTLKGKLANKGYLIASYAQSKGVDPYLATAIMMHETGCEWGCSTLVVKCNNVGGMKGSGCGSYSSFQSLDTGIKKFIDNLYKNYYRYGLDTPDKMNKKYAADPKWASKVNAYIKKIKSK